MTSCTAAAARTWMCRTRNASSRAPCRAGKLV
jgi:hypothetical protein